MEFVNDKVNRVWLHFIKYGAIYLMFVLGWIAGELIINKYKPDTANDVVRAAHKEQRVANEKQREKDMVELAKMVAKEVKLVKEFKTYNYYENKSRNEFESRYAGFGAADDSTKFYIWTGHVWSFEFD